MGPSHAVDVIFHLHICNKRGHAIRAQVLDFSPVRSSSSTLSPEVACSPTTTPLSWLKLKRANCVAGIACPLSVVG